jgi:hypothetical protein
VGWVLLSEKRLLCSAGLPAERKQLLDSHEGRSYMARMKKTADKQPSFFRIKQIAAPVGAWYELRHLVDEDRWFIARVCLWAAGEREGSVDHILAITTDGVPQSGGEPARDIYFVFGEDKSGSGKTWNDIYSDCEDEHVNVREITDPSKPQKRNGRRS